MQSPEKKQLQSVIQSSLSESPESIQSRCQQINGLLSCRVDMPKHFITTVSKHMSTKEQQKLFKIFELLMLISQSFQNKIAFFNQVSANKQFLLKISSLLAMKDIKQDLKTKIVDVIYQWKQMFKQNKQLFPNFWNLFSNFEKKGYAPSNLNFQTRCQQQPPSATSQLQGPNCDIFDLLQSQQAKTGPLQFDKIQRTALVLFNTVLSKLILQNIIISNTSAQILDFPPIIKQNMAQIKILQDKLNKNIGQHKAQITVDTAMNLIKAIHLTQKRYTQLITRYLPQKFVLNQHLLKFEEFCKKGSFGMNENRQTSDRQIDLLDIGGFQNKGNDLLDLDAPASQKDQSRNQKKNIVNFFGNLLDKVNKPTLHQATLSNQPIQNDFKTDLDFTVYGQPNPILQQLNYVKNSTFQNNFKF